VGEDYAADYAADYTQTTRRLDADYMQTMQTGPQTMWTYKVHISKHQCYLTMWDYLSVPTTKKPQTELDAAAWTSPGHPALAELPYPPEHLQRAWQQRAQQARQPAGEKKSMQVLEFYEVVKQNRQRIHEEDDLCEYIILCLLQLNGFTGSFQ